jgi:hypothetical protein
LSELPVHPPYPRKLALILAIITGAGIAHAQPAAPVGRAFEWTLDECVSRKLSPRQLEPLILLEGQTVQSSVPAAATRHTQIHISCADDEGGRLVVTTQVTEEVATRTIDLRETSDELRPRIVALAATELLRRISPPATRPRQEPAGPAPARAATPPPTVPSPAAPLPTLAATPPLTLAADARAVEPPSSSWISPPSARAAGLTLLGTSAVLTVTSFVMSTVLIAVRGGGDADLGLKLQDMTELSIATAATTAAAGFTAMGLYGYGVTHSAAALRAPPPSATTLRAGRAALGLTIIGVAALVPATVTLALAANNPDQIYESGSERGLYFTAATLYSAATLTLISAAALASFYWTRRHPAVRLSLRPSTTGGTINLAGAF